MLEALERALRRAAPPGRSPQGGLFIWATLDERIDTTDLLALARKSEGVAFVPGRAAYVDGRSGASSMRLNFAGMPEDEIREGIRRIGGAIDEQLGLLGSLSGRARTPARRRQLPADPSRRGATPPRTWPTCVELPRRERRRRGSRRQDR